MRYTSKDLCTAANPSRPQDYASRRPYHAPTWCTAAARLPDVGPDPRTRSPLGRHPQSGRNAAAHEEGRNASARETGRRTRWTVLRRLRQMDSRARRATPRPRSLSVLRPRSRFRPRSLSSCPRSLSPRPPSRPSSPPHLRRVPGRCRVAATGGWRQTVDPRSGPPAPRRRARRPCPALHRYGACRRGRPCSPRRRPRVAPPPAALR